MSITSRIRKSKIVVTALLLVFVLGFLFPYIAEIGNQFFTGPKTHVGTIGKNPIPYHPDYRILYDKMLQEEIQTQGQYYQGIEAHVHHRAWQKCIAQHGFQPTYDQLGLAVTDQERYDMLLGHDVPKDIQRYFQDPTTQTFDKKQYLLFLRNLATNTFRQEAGRDFEEDLATTRLQEKLGTLIDQSTRTPHLHHKHTQQHQKTIRVRMVCIPYASIADSEVRNQVTDQHKKDYYKAHPNEYTIEEPSSTRTIEYVEIPILPDNQAMQRVEQNLTNLKTRFLNVKTKDVQTFAKQYTDNPDQIIVEWEEQDLPPHIQAALDKHTQDPTHTVIGPIRQGSTAILYRYLGMTTSSPWGLNKPIRTHRFAKIEQHADQGLSKNKTFAEANELVKRVKATHAWKKVANEEFGLPIKKEDVPLEVAQQVGRGDYRKLIRWLFCDAKQGEVSPAIEIKGRSYVIAMYTQQQKPGHLTLEQAQEEIETTLFNQHKAAKIQARLHDIGIQDKTLQEIAQAYGPDAFTHEQTHLTFADPTTVGNQPIIQAIGAAFGLQVGERTTCIQDQHYIIIVERLPDSTDSSQAPTNPDEDDIQAQTQQRVVNAILHHQHIQDERYRFYD